MAATLQHVTEAAMALRDFDDPDRNRTAALRLSRAIHRLQEELPLDGVADNERIQLTATQETLKELLARLSQRVHSRSEDSP